MCDDDVADAAVVLRRVDPAPVPELGDSQPRQFGKHLVVVRRDGQRLRQAAEETLALDAPTAQRDIPGQPGNPLPAQTAVDVSLQQDPPPALLGERRPHLDLEPRVGGERLLDGRCEPLPVVRVHPVEELRERVEPHRVAEPVHAAHVL